MLGDEALLEELYHCWDVQWLYHLEIWFSCWLSLFAHMGFFLEDIQVFFSQNILSFLCTTFI